jgi:hypothetical protein
MKQKRKDVYQIKAQAADESLNSKPKQESVF